MSFKCKSLQCLEVVFLYEQLKILYTQVFLPIYEQLKSFKLKLSATITLFFYTDKINCIFKVEFNIFVCTFFMCKNLELKKKST